jgi:hypothetical protein
MMALALLGMVGLAGTVVEPARAVDTCRESATIA